MFKTQTKTKNFNQYYDIMIMYTSYILYFYKYSDIIYIICEQ